MLKKYFSLLFCSLVWTGYGYGQTYSADWPSLNKRSTPQWWSDAKFGIFIHWGVYSVPAYAPVKGIKGVYEKYAEHYEDHLKTGNQSFKAFHDRYFGKDFAYRDFAPMFKAEYFDPDQWADLLEKSGAKYVVLTAKHHDGFCLWPSAQSPGWNSMDIGPHRDLMHEVSDAVLKKGIHFGLYYSLLEWSNTLYQKNTISQYVDEHMVPQLTDLVNRYHPEVIFADGEWDYPSNTFKSESFLAWLYNDSTVKQTIVVNDRWGKETRSKDGGYYTTEYDLVNDKLGIGDQAAHPWEESRGIGTSYGYNRFEAAGDYSGSKELIRLLIQKVSSGGNLLLDIGPDANGLIPVVMQERLMDIGGWLKLNGEAIYGTAVPGAAIKTSNQDTYLTASHKNIYVLVTEWPKSLITIHGLKRNAGLSLLGSSAKINFRFTVTGDLIIDPPRLTINELPCVNAWVFKLENAY